MKNKNVNIIYSKDKSLNQIFIDSLVNDIIRIYKNNINLQNIFLDRKRKKS